jgi:hypothetical protein
MANVKPKQQRYVATVGITIDPHEGVEKEIRVEVGEDASAVCACHVQQLIAEGDLVPAAEPNGGINA